MDLTKTKKATLYIYLKPILQLGVATRPGSFVKRWMLELCGTHARIKEKNISYSKPIDMYTLFRFQFSALLTIFLTCFFVLLSQVKGWQAQARSLSSWAERFLYNLEVYAFEVLMFYPLVRHITIPFLNQLFHFNIWLANYRKPHTVRDFQAAASKKKKSGSAIHSDDPFQKEMGWIHLDADSPER